MDVDQIKPGKTRVTIAEKFKKNATRGMFIKDDHLSNRKNMANGIVLQWVPGHGGDVWFVAHAMSKDGKTYEDVAAYAFNEFDAFDFNKNPESKKLNNDAFLKKYGPKLA